jgi:shikimate dehydrogenase
VLLEKLAARMFVGDVITAPEMTPLMLAAEACGARYSTGIDMIKASVEIQVSFFIGSDA